MQIEIEEKIFTVYLPSMRTVEKPQTFYRLRLLFYLAFGRSVFSNQQTTLHQQPPAECHAVQAYRAQSDHSASVHTQEQPPYRHELDIPYKYATDAKVYVIDDKTHSTMLLASEY